MRKRMQRIKMWYSWSLYKGCLSSGHASLLFNPELFQKKWLLNTPTILTNLNLAQDDERKGDGKNKNTIWQKLKLVINNLCYNFLLMSALQIY